MVFAGINYLSILIAVIVSMMAGAAWYGIFAKQWMAAAGLKEEELDQSATKYAIAAICQLIMAYLMAGLIGHMGEITLMNGLIAAGFAWLGFCVAPMAVNHRFQGAGWNLTLIDGGYWLVVFLLQGAIIGWMGV